MCNLYRMKGSVAEVAALFGTPAAEGLNFAETLYPGYRGLVVADGALRAMNWGFPLILTGKQGQKLKPKPVTNARDDKLSSPFWRDSFTHRRCLIPVTQWAEPEGPPRHNTRTWYAPKLKDTVRPEEGLSEAQKAEAKARLEGPHLPSNEPNPSAPNTPLFAIAGLWRPTAEWGDSYAMVMCPASAQMIEVHDRMPVLLTPDQWLTWTQGPPIDAFALVQTWPGDLTVERTRENWVTGQPT